MHRIFISHASRDNAKALALTSWLEERGFGDCFLDFDADRGIAPGERWAVALKGAVDRCEVVVVLLSPAWCTSEYCKAELALARLLGKRLLGVLVDETDKTALPAGLATEWQLCDLSHSHDPVSIVVERHPAVPRTAVAFPREGLERLQRGLGLAGLGPTAFKWPPQGDPGRDPYPGLRALDENDAAVFFGREAALVRALDQVRRMGDRGVERLLVILGASGAGKSSFLRAGLLPRLSRDAGRYVVLPTIRPGRAPLTGPNGLVESLRAALDQSTSEVASALESRGMAALVQQLLAGVPTEEPSASEGPRVLVVAIDQAEELFDRVARHEAVVMVRQLLALAADAARSASSGAGTPFRVMGVLTIRSDALPRLQAQTLLSPLSPVLFNLPPMPRDNFRSVIEGPARRHSESVSSLIVDPLLTERLVADAHGGDALPMLALTLQWLYRAQRKRTGTRLRLEDFARLGGDQGVIEGAIARALEHPDSAPAIPSDAAAQKVLLRSIFPHIATVEPETGEWKRRQAELATLRAMGLEAEAMVKRLVDERLLVQGLSAKMGSQGASVVEVAHEAVLRQWPLISEWLREHSAALAAIEGVRRAAREWARARDPVLLVHSGHRLDMAESALHDTALSGRFGQTETEYVRACRKRDRDVQRERESHLRMVESAQQARARLQRRWSVVLMVALFTLIALVAWNIRQGRELSSNLSALLANAADAAAARGRFDQSIRLGLLAAADSWLRPAHPVAEPVLRSAVDRNPLRSELAGQWVGFARGGQAMVTLDEDGGQVFIWDAASGDRVLQPLEHPGVKVTSLCPDGVFLLTAAADGTVGRWDVSTGQRIGGWVKTAPSLAQIGCVASGNMISASSDGTVRLWDRDSGLPTGRTMPFAETVVRLAVAPGGATVVVEGPQSLQMLHAATLVPIGSPVSHAGTRDYWFSSDGTRLAVNDRKRFRVFDVAGDVMREVPGTVPREHASQDLQHAVLQMGKGSGAPVAVVDLKSFQVVPIALSDRQRITLSPSGRLVLAASDREVLLYDARTGKEAGRRLVHDESVINARVSADDRWVVTQTGPNGQYTFHVWDARSGVKANEPLVHPRPTGWGIDFARDGRHLVTRDEGGRTQWVWTLGRKQLATIEHASGLRVLAVGGGLALSHGDDQVVRRWRLSTGEPEGSPLEDVLKLSPEGFADDGGRFVATRPSSRGDGDSAYIWRSSDAELLCGPIPVPGGVFGAMLRMSSDGTGLLSLDEVGGNFHLWRATGPDRCPERVMHDQPWGALAQDARFSPNGRQVVLGERDGKVAVLDAMTGRLLQSVSHGAEVNSVALSDDNASLVASGPGSIALYDLTTGTPRVRWRTASAPRVEKDGRPLGVVRFSDSGRRVVVSDSETVHVLDAESGVPVIPTIKAERGFGPALLDASRDGARLLTRGPDFSAQMWDGRSGIRLGQAMRHKDEVMAARIAGEGKVVTASLDGTIKVWDAKALVPASRSQLMAAACSQLSSEARRLRAADFDVARTFPVPAAWIGADVCRLVRQ